MSDYSSDEAGDEIIRSAKQITVFPTIVEFPPTYVNVLSHFSLNITNPYHLQQTVNLKLEGDNEFSISQKSITIEGGSVYRCVISFSPKTEGKFTSLLKAYCDGCIPCVVMISAKSNESPLVFPKEIIEDFVFDDSATICNFEVQNKSLTKSLHVVMTVNTSAFTLPLSQLDIEQGESCECNLVFDPSRAEEIQKDPMINVQCAESGDSFNVPLMIGQIRNTITVDFGNSSIGQHKSHVLSIPQSAAIIQRTDENSPFFVTFEERNYSTTELCLDDEAKKDLVIEYEANEPGKHEEVIEFDSFFLQLTAACFKPFYTLQEPEKVGDPAVITNNSKKTKVCAISFTETYETSTEVKMLPGESKEIQLGTEKNLFISWNHREDPVFDRFEFFTESSTIITDESILGSRTVLTTSPGRNTLPITLNNDGDTPKRVSLVIDNPDFTVDDNFKTLVLEPHSMQSISVSFSPQKSTATTASLTVLDDDANEEITSLQLHGALQLVCDHSFVPLFGINDKTSVIMAVSGANSISVTAPDWVDAPDTIKSGRKFTVSCDEIPSSSMCDYITFESDTTASTSIPILAYKGSSEISYKPPEPLHKAKNGMMFTIIDVVNDGIRPGFVVFTCEDSEEINIRASPSAAIIPAGKTVSFKFVVDANASIEEAVIMHSGDEILRQIRAYLRPSSFYATSFNGVKTRDEINKFVDCLDEINEKQFAKIFKKSLTKQKIVFEQKIEIPVDSIIPEFASMPDFSISESEIDFGFMLKGSTTTKTIWLSNTSREVLELELYCDNPMISFPKNIRLKASEQFRLIIGIECTEESIVDTDIEITGTVDTKFIHVKAEIEEPMVQVETMDFGTCPIGRIARGNLKIINRRAIPVTVAASTNAPFVLNIKEVQIEPLSFIKFPVHFIPKTVGIFQEDLEFTSNEVHPFSVTLTGKSEVLDV